MKNLIKLLATIVLLMVGFNLFGQEKYPFKIEKTGKGEQAIIFIPGFASSGEVWKETTTKFEKYFTCYTLTMAGFAGVKPKEDSSFNAWSKQIASFIKIEKIEKPILIGHSMGGGLALNIASEYPNLIKKIVVVDALPCLMALTNPSFSSKKENDCSEMIRQITSTSEEEFLKMQERTVMGLVVDKNMQKTIVKWSVQSDRRTFASIYCDFLNVDLREKIKTITCSSLILLESYFKNFNTQIREQYKNLKTAKLQYANKGLHFIMYDDKDWYFNHLNKYLNAK